MTDVFILGAGFSKAISNTMPLLAELSDEVGTRLGVKNPFGYDIEMWLTYLAESYPWLPEPEILRDQALFLDMSRGIGDAIRQRETQVIKAASPEWLSKLVNWWHREQAYIITLNYDDLVERVARTLKINGRGSNDPLDIRQIYPVAMTPANHRLGAAWNIKRTPSFRLIKLHGSINWYYSGSTSYHGETIYFLHVPPWHTTESEPPIGVDAYDEDNVLDKVPLIIPPVLDKVPFFQHETIRALWSQAGFGLRNATRIFCLGYSLPSTDIAMRFFFHSMSPGRQVKFYVVDTDNKAQERFRLLLPPTYELDSRFISSDDPIPKFVEGLPKLS